MSLALAVAGTVHRDDIRTPYGRATSLGGSAIYFALAASRFVRVHVSGIAGDDCLEELEAVLAGCDIDCEGLVLSDKPTFVWHAEHDFARWVTRSEFAEEGCDPDWNAQLRPSSADAPILFVASMRPALQRVVLDQSRAETVGIDTMTVYTEAERESVSDVCERADLLFVNRFELASLRGDSDWLSAARALCGRGRTRAVVVKRGPDGAALVTADDQIARPAQPVPLVVDPTGAGDALAGGFLGYCARAGRTDPAVYADALSAGLECAAHAITSFGTADLAAYVKAH